MLLQALAKTKAKTRAKTLTKQLAATCLLLTLNATATEVEISGKAGVEGRYFFESGQYADQLTSAQTSLFVESEFYWSWNDGNDSFIFKPFYRIDSKDDERSRGDIRELSYIHASDDWELRVGIRKEFWGVTEFQHLVDVINQTDGVEDIDGEDKFGQLMVNLSLVKDWGIVDLYLLPGFRERSFAGEEGRLRGPINIDTDNVSYESSAAEQHLDFAMRWSHSLGDVDIGTYWFHGTNRDPMLVPTKNAPVQNGETISLGQYYNQMDQIGLDLQVIVEDWLLKFESIYRSTSEEEFWATQSGFEYSFIGVFDTAVDLGLLMEYSWDSRGEGDINSSGSSFQNDVFFGSRIALNDMQSSELLMGFSADLDHNAFNFLIEANRRIGDSFKVNLDLRLFQSTEPADQLYALRDDDHFQLTLEWYY